MKITHMIAVIGLAVATIGAAAPAEAQRHHGAEQGRHNDRNDGRGWNGRHHGHWWNGDRGRHCRTEWRHHHRVRICR